MTTSYASLGATSSSAPAQAVPPRLSSLAFALLTLAQSSKFVLELGAGSGHCTAGLSHYCRKKSFIATESDKAAAKKLKARFPNTRIYRASPWGILDDFRPAGPATVLSHISFSGLKNTDRTNTMESIFDFLRESSQSQFVQYTRTPRQPFEVPAGFYWTRVKWVLFRGLPAFIWTLQAVPHLHSGFVDSCLDDFKPADTQIMG